MKITLIAVVVTLAAFTLTGGGAAADPSINYNASKSNTGNVYFRDLSPKAQKALQSLCAEHNGHVVTNDRGQMGCQVESINVSKSISDGADGAAKGQATE
jgi:hypothetical protein